jgi:hypothetical protein
MQLDLTVPNETCFVSNIVTEFYELQSLLVTCENLIEQKRLPDFSEEIFPIDINSFCISLKGVTEKLESLCEKQTSNMKENRGTIMTTTNSKFISRDPSDNKNVIMMNYGIWCLTALIVI